MQLFFGFDSRILITLACPAPRISIIVVEIPDPDPVPEKRHLWRSAAAACSLQPERAPVEPASFVLCRHWHRKQGLLG